MLATHTLVFALGAFLSLPQITLGGLVQVPNLALPSSSNAAANQNAIRQIFTDSYAVYQCVSSSAFNELMVDMARRVERLHLDTTRSLL